MPLKALALSSIPAHPPLHTTTCYSRSLAGCYDKSQNLLFSRPVFLPRYYHFRGEFHQRRGMKIATLQFAPRLGDVEGNIRRADDLLKRGKDGLSVESMRPEILVLPELAFSGELPRLWSFLFCSFRNICCPNLDGFGRASCGLLCYLCYDVGV